ncbi:protein PhnB [Afipia carboxidovorans OM5]|uniref:Putative 3-demethylubiquinone-9 3-methyltransferase n=1 Tax=Afipia carboxidovorans (strain ATCC 49405 / DSM 1227 / KCTC 32145 / OM5) TaxID=504832 RepID=B6JDI5_AFIC5|nr:VOC family protein [Afipia carboxidovorans]ACI91897.1 protein PhnB [Afipia carboxidovorans OM5]AEI04243.1 putative 3-demethylubiquinone-9 3-methyltransferase [Afipia carboxidovorans OM4]AEI07873.1 putative 3-demethylubiquinone-9 3-methyltransferase [Afipia carboxidovorans OM5]BEV45302.1 VOC family protein [Afipia carboxidovorans]
MPVTPYLFFDGRCEEALAFYEKALGAKVGMKMRFKDAPETPPSEECAGIDDAQLADKIMHASFEISGSTVMASDGFARGETRFAGFSLSINTQTEAEVDRVIKALAEGGEIRMQPEKTFFAKRFGEVVDRFGIDWLVICE